MSVNNSLNTSINIFYLGSKWADLEYKHSISHSGHPKVKNIGTSYPYTFYIEIWFLQHFWNGNSTYPHPWIYENRISPLPFTKNSYYKMPMVWVLDISSPHKQGLRVRSHVHVLYLPIKKSSAQQRNSTLLCVSHKTSFQSKFKLFNRVSTKLISRNKWTNHQNIS